jgi:predicted site-specific integrase-resolvase
METMEVLTLEKRLNRIQTCRKLKVSDETIRRWVKDGKLIEEPYPAGKRTWVRYRQSEVERVKAYLDANLPLPVVNRN